MPFVIGTAGHIDHGKSTLVQALSGMDPDRLQEEKQRQMTIDLGFAWFTLPSGEEVGVVDVPGHRDFIENMLAGVGGIDSVLLVVAADEGVMPQTREHLAIVDLLGVPTGVVALTKADLIDDPEWLEIVTEDVRDVLTGTVLHDAPLVPVSALTGGGLTELTEALTAGLGSTPARADQGTPRLPVDRVFTVSGFGTVVTGTLLDGALRVGDTVEIAPRGLQSRIRGLQNHQQPVEVAWPGSRVAVNLVGVAVEDIRRGDVVSVPGTLPPTTLIDVSYRHLADADHPLKHDAEVKFFSGAMEVLARARLIGARELPPGQEGWLQLRLSSPAALQRGDRFILRRPSPPQTIGGGVVLDPTPPMRWRRFKPQVAQRFERLAEGTPEEVLLHTLEQHTALTADQIAVQSGLPPETVSALLEESGRVRALDGSLWMAEAVWERVLRRLAHVLDEYHTTHPLEPGAPRELLRSRIGVEQRLFGLLVDVAEETGVLVDAGVTLRLADFAIRFTKAQQERLTQLWARIEEAPTAPPTVKDAVELVGEDVLNALAYLGEVVIVENGVFFDAQTYGWMVKTVRDTITVEGSISVGRARDLFGTSRKYVLGLLEYLDAQGVTRREGDGRVLHEG